MAEEGRLFWMSSPMVVTEIGLDFSEGVCGVAHPFEDGVTCWWPKKGSDTWHLLFNGHVAHGVERNYSWPMTRAEHLQRFEETFTLGDALAWLQREPFGCACPGTPICCFDQTRLANRLVAMAQQIINHLRALKEARE